jgi:BON domain
MYIMLSYKFILRHAIKIARCTQLSTAASLLLGFGVIAVSPAMADNELANRFDDPFIAITTGMPNCPAPLGPMVSPAEVADVAHYRSQRGVSCHMGGRCRLPNAYLYDKEIIPRVKLAIDTAGRFKGTSVWAYGQRRWVFLQGCVATRAEADELERIVRLIDDVESVVNELMVGTDGKTPYRRAIEP